MNSEPAIPRGIYRHYKGREYEVLTVATHSETGEQLVVYRALYGDFAVWTRPAAMFAAYVEHDGQQRPRFSWMAPPSILRLSAAGQQAARNFIFTQGRPLDQVRYRQCFEGGSAEDVFDELAAYRTTDGGFGRALEPDFRAPQSSILATTTALQILRSVGAKSAHELVQGAIGYLAATFETTMGAWPLIPAEEDGSPHAPWWTAGPEHAGWFGGYLVNPRAEIVGHLYHYAATDSPAWLDSLARALAHYLMQRAVPLDLNEILCTLRLVETKGVPPDLKQAATIAIERSLPASMATTVEQWENYSLQPLALAPSPRSPLAQKLSDLLPANLDFRIDEQELDGAWSPTWSWGDLGPDHWPAARRDWQSVLTLEALRQLDDWGRLAL